MLTLSSAVLGATLVAVCTAGGTYGLWADSAPVNAGVVTSGSLTLLVNNSSSSTIDSTPWNAMFPGDRVQQAVDLKNIGTVGADITVSTSSTAAIASDYTVEVSRGACPAPNSDVVAANSLASPAFVGSWAAGQTLAACVEVTLLASASNASQAATVPLTVTFTATQKVPQP